MKLYALDIPDDPAERPEWLERHLMGLDLAQLALELRVLTGTPPAPPQALHEVLGEQSADVLHSGLGCLSREQLRQLLRQPDLLLELQRLILDEGADYWVRVPADAQVENNSQAVRGRLDEHIGADSSGKLAFARPRTVAPRRWLWAGAGWLAAAATILIAFFVHGTRVRQLESEVARQTAQADLLRKELRDQQASAAIRAQPGDLPEGDELLARAPRDPPDLPQDDPEDLPEQSANRSRQG